MLVEKVTQSSLWYAIYKTPCAVHGSQDTVAVFAPQMGNGELSVIEELISGGLISYQGNQEGGPLLITLLIRIITSWGLGKVLGR